jgi:hypothetical protein
MDKNKFIASKSLTAFFLLFSFSFFGACSINFIKGKDAAEKSVKKFHDQLNAGNFKEIYAGLADEFKNASSEEETLQLFEAVSRKLGKVKNAKLQSWNMQANTGGNFVLLAYETEFEHDKGEEKFTFLMKGDEARIAGYNVNSKAFMK